MKQNKITIIDFLSAINTFTTAYGFHAKDIFFIPEFMQFLFCSHFRLKMQIQQLNKKLNKTVHRCGYKVMS